MSIEGHGNSEEDEYFFSMGWPNFRKIDEQKD
jgi:hypothetical protein